MMKAPTNRATPANTNRNVVNDPMPFSIDLAVSAATLAAVTAWYWGGSTEAIRWVSVADEIPGWAATSIESH